MDYHDDNSTVALVSRLNDKIFEQQVRREARFELADVEAVISSDAFFRAGNAYLSGIWSQAGEGPPGQQEVLAALAAGSLTTTELASATGLGKTALTAALDRLKHHDIVASESGAWRCRVELMHHWLAARSSARELHSSVGEEGERGTDHLAPIRPSIE